MADPTFNPDAPGYDPNNAILLAKASSLAYKGNTPVEEKEVRDTLKSWWFPRSKLITGISPDPFTGKKNDTQLVVAKNDKALILAFRGTEKNLEDWLSDGKVRFTGGPFGKDSLIHEGFGLALGSVWSQVLEAIKDFHVEGQGLWITGHSLGAALATLATAKLLEKPEQIPGGKKKLRALYTFGSPRVGNQTFTNKFDELFKSNTFRFVNNRDIVTRVALTLLGYHHVGHAYYIDGNGELQIDPSNWDMAGELLKSATSLITPITGKHITAIEDHSIDGYARQIENSIHKPPSTQG